MQDRDFPTPGQFIHQAPAGSTVRWALLRAEAHVRAGRPVSARAELERAIPDSAVGLFTPPDPTAQAEKRVLLEAIDALQAWGWEQWGSLTVEAADRG